MDKLERLIAESDERRRQHELTIARILEERAKERELRRENLRRMRGVDTMVSRNKMPFISATTIQTKKDRESVHDMAQKNSTLLRILRKLK